MQMIPVSSSNIAAIGYESSTLYVQFNTGKSYAYYNVPRNLYDGLMSAASHGEYLDKYIKKGGYKYSLIR